MTHAAQDTIVLALLLASLAWATESRWVLNYHRLSTRQISITCANGGDPTGIRQGDTLIIDCGK